ncbi:MAG: efflux RND transporter periplasmic adaptor subunit [Bacteroidia bacterium]
MIKNKKKFILIAASAGALLLIWVIWAYADNKTEKDILVQVKHGAFEISVFTTGELEAKNSININGPEGLRSVNIFQVKITDMIPEGSIVKKGDYIAGLDKAEVGNKLKDASNDLQKFQSQYKQTQLDTALQLRQARDEMVNQEYGLKEKQIALEQSAYEPPATIRQIQLDFDKTKRALEQSTKNYEIKKSQLTAKMEEVGAALSQAQTAFDRLTDLLLKFTITAPEPGMVIYQREWNGRKRGVGSTVGVWDPTVATLPDLSIMSSKTYVNEVDIRKIQTGQAVQVSLDAYPEKKLSGVVTSVANVGEQSPKNDSKVFEVVIRINEKDTTLRPAMTTGNRILVQQLKNVLYIPLESLHHQGDSLTYVLVREGLSMLRKEVTTGETNENFVVIKKGLSENEKVYLSLPDNPETFKLTRLSGQVQTIKTKKQ